MNQPASKNAALAQQAEALFLKGEFPQAYALFVKLAKSEPNHDPYRLRLAETCMHLHKPQDALRIYKHLAGNLIQQGKIAQAISVSKRVLEIDPDDREIQKNLENLYAQAVEDPTDHWKQAQKQARESVQAMASSPLQMPSDSIDLAGPSDRVTISAEELAGRRSKQEIDIAIPSSSGLELEDALGDPMERSVSGADGFSNVSFSKSNMMDLSLASNHTPHAFPRIPLFSDLPSGAFAKVVDHFKRQSFPPRTVILKQGDPGDSIYILAAGAVRVVREVNGQEKEMGALKPGDFFGEFPFFSKTPREASVISENIVELLELTRLGLEEIMMENPKIERAMFNLYKERVLRNLLSESPLFSSIAPADLEHLLKLFSYRAVEPKKVIVKEGDPPDDFYVIQSGKVQVNKKGTAQPLAHLGPGDFFGEYSMITNSPRSATVTAVVRTELVMLSLDGFRQLLHGRPQVIETLRRIAKERMTANMAKNG